MWLVCVGCSWSSRLIVSCVWGYTITCIICLGLWTSCTFPLVFGFGFVKVVILHLTLSFRIQIVFVLCSIVGLDLLWTRIVWINYVCLLLEYCNYDSNVDTMILQILVFITFYFSFWGNLFRVGYLLFIFWLIRVVCCCG